MHVLILQHIAAEHPAAFGRHMHAAGDTCEVVRFFEGDRIPDFAPFDALLVMGGPMDVWETDTYPWLTDEIAAIRHWVTKDHGPFLGICLGHQLLAIAMGGTCGRMEQPEISVSEVTCQPDPLFAHLPRQFDAMHWHGVEVTQLPADTRRVASSEGCQTQAIRVGSRAWGLQFHPELEAGTATGWLEDPGNRQVAEAWLGSPGAATAFAADCEAHVPTFTETSKAIYKAWRHAR